LTALATVLGWLPVLLLIAVAAESAPPPKPLIHYGNLKCYSVKTGQELQCTPDDVDRFRRDHACDGMKCGT
jgi:hypothetical protein